MTWTSRRSWTTRHKVRLSFDPHRCQDDDGDQDHAFVIVHRGFVRGWGQPIEDAMPDEEVLSAPGQAGMAGDDRPHGPVLLQPWHLPQRPSRSCRLCDGVTVRNLDGRILESWELHHDDTCGTERWGQEF